MNKENSKATFKKHLNRLIEKYDIKRVSLSKLTGASVGHINRWTDGSLMPTWNQLERLTEIFGVDASYLLGCSVNELKYTTMFKT